MTDLVGGSIIWNLDADSSKFDAKMSEAQTRAKKTGDTIDKSLSDSAKKASKEFKGFGDIVASSMDKARSSSMLFAGGLLAIGTSLVGAAGIGLKTAGEFETLTTALETVTGSSDLAVAAMEKIKQTAKESPFFEVSTLAQFTQLMAASGQAIDEAVASGIRFGDVAAAFGKGNTEVTRMGNTLSQVIGKGKADIVDFKELVNAGWVSVRKDVAQTMGVSMAQFEELLSSGKITYEEISKAAEKFNGSAEKQSKSLSALWGRLKETISTTFADIVIETGVFDAAKSAIGTLITAIETIDTEKIRAVFQFIADYAPIIAGAIIGGLVPAMYAFALAMIPVVTGLIASSIALLPWILLGAAVGAAILGIIYVIQNWGAILDWLTPKITETIQWFTALGQSIVNNIQMAFQFLVINVPMWIANILLFFWTLPYQILIIMATALGYIVGWGLNVYNYLLVNVPMWVNSIGQWLSELPGRVSEWLTATFNNFVLWGKSVWSYLSTNVPMWIAGIITWLSELPGKAYAELEKFKAKLKQSFEESWKTIETEIRTWPSKIADWGKRIGDAFVNGVKGALSGLRDAFVNGFNAAKGAIEGKSPPKEGPFKEIDVWGFNVGQAWADGLKSAIGGIDLNSGFEVEPVYGSLRGESMSPRSSGVRQEIAINIGSISSQEDIDSLIRQLGFRASIAPQLSL